MDFTTLERVTPNSYWRCKIKRQKQIYRILALCLAL